MKKPATRARSGSGVSSVPSTRGRSRRVQPAIWAAIITTVRAPVASRPNKAQPCQSIESPPHLQDRFYNTVLKIDILNLEPADRTVKASNLGEAARTVRLHMSGSEAAGR